MEIIRFSEPYITGKEETYLKEVFLSKRFSGNGDFTKRCQSFLEDTFSFNKVLLTQSCTDALEMSALLCNIQPGDEVIMPSYTFVSTANAFELRGARIVFCDSMQTHPNMDVNLLEELITSKTKAVVCVHYGGVPCDMQSLSEICKKHGIYLIEDAAQAIGVKHKDAYLGAYGDLSCFSFHETKNIGSGEGGCLVINNDQFIDRSEIIWEKGTNRAAFYRHEVDKYGWVDVGSSFLPSEFTAAILLAQLEMYEHINNKRMGLWKRYEENLNKLDELNHVANNLNNAPHNAHVFYVMLKGEDQRNALMAHLNQEGVKAVFHYQSLHKSEKYLQTQEYKTLPASERFESCLLRLPLHANMTLHQVDVICEKIAQFF